MSHGSPRAPRRGLYHGRGLQNVVRTLKVPLQAMSADPPLGCEANRCTVVLVPAVTAIPRCTVHPMAKPPDARPGGTETTPIVPTCALPASFAEGPAKRTTMLSLVVAVFTPQWPRPKSTAVPVDGGTKTIVARVVAPDPELGR